MAPDIFFPSALSSPSNASSSPSQNFLQAQDETTKFTDDYVAPKAPVIQPNAPTLTPSPISASGWVPVQYIQPPGSGPITFFSQLAISSQEGDTNSKKYYSAADMASFSVTYTTPDTLNQIIYYTTEEPTLPQNLPSQKPITYFSAQEAPVLQQDLPTPFPETYYTAPQAAVLEPEHTRVSPSTYYTAPETPFLNQDQLRKYPSTYYTAPEAPVLQGDPPRPTSVSFYTAPEAPVLKDLTNRSPSISTIHAAPALQENSPKSHLSTFYNAPESLVLLEAPSRLSSSTYYTTTEAPAVKQDLTRQTPSRHAPEGSDTPRASQTTYFSIPKASIQQDPPRLSPTAYHSVPETSTQSQDQPQLSGPLYYNPNTEASLHQDNQRTFPISTNFYPFKLASIPAINYYTVQDVPTQLPQQGTAGIQPGGCNFCQQ
jgi:hypothetical protein